MLWAIWYCLYNFKNVMNTQGGVLLLSKLQTEACNFTKVTLLHGCFSRFLNCANGIKLREASNMYVVLDKYKCYGCEAGYYCLGDGNEVNCTTINKHYFSFGMASSCSKCPEGWVSFLFYKIKTFQSQVPKDNFNFMWTTNQNWTLAKHLYDVDGVSICSFSRKSLSIG